MYEAGEESYFLFSLGEGREGERREGEEREGRGKEREFWLGHS